jgi:hypothetical protein
MIFVLDGGIPINKTTIIIDTELGPFVGEYNVYLSKKYLYANARNKILHVEH